MTRTPNWGAAPMVYLVSHKLKGIFRNGFGEGTPDLQSSFCHLLAVRPWASHCTSLSRSFLQSIIRHWTEPASRLAYGRHLTRTARASPPRGRLGSCPPAVHQEEQWEMSRRQARWLAGHSWLLTSLGPRLVCLGRCADGSKAVCLTEGL